MNSDEVSDRFSRQVADPQEVESVKTELYAKFSDLAQYVNNRLRASGHKDSVLRDLESALRWSIDSTDRDGVRSLPPAPGPDPETDPVGHIEFGAATATPGSGEIGIPMPPGSTGVSVQFVCQNSDDESRVDFVYSLDYGEPPLAVLRWTNRSEAEILFDYQVRVTRSVLSG